MKLSNNLLGILNVITALISLPIIGAGVWLAIKHQSECARLLQWPAIALGAFILVVSVAGLVGSFWRRRALLGLYMVVVFLLILAVIAFTVFAVIVTNKGAGHAVSGKGIYEYRLGDYSTWLQRNVVNKPVYWRKIKSCLVHSKACKSLQDDEHITSVTTFYKQSLSPIQSGCCKPPTSCNYAFVNATLWVHPTNTNADIDCKVWSNDSNTLCFDCDSCKAGVLQDAKKNWKRLVIIDAAVLLLLILVSTLACCAMSNCHRRMPLDAGFYVKA